MNRLLIATIAIATLAGSGLAAAADIDVQVKAPPRHCGGGAFQGIYAGIHGGGVMHTAHRSDHDAFLGGGLFTSPATFTTNTAGGVIGGQVGYNFQCRNAVFGFEVDGSWMQVDSSFRLFPNFGPPESTVRSRLDTFVSARARAGVVAADSLLLYATAGVGAIHNRTTWSVVFPGGGPLDIDSTSFNEWIFGWVAGFGAEWAISERLSIRSEVLYLGTADRNFTFTSLFAGGPVSVTHSDSVWMARIGANVRLTKD